MEILSDTVFKGNVNVEGNINVGPRGQLSVSEFEFANDIIRFNVGQGIETTYLKSGTMATTSQIDTINTNIATINSNIKNITLGNPEIPANCTRFYFYCGSDYTLAYVPTNGSIPIVQVYKRSDVTNNQQLTQMDIEYCVDYCIGKPYYNFIGNIADHSEIIEATEFALAIRN